MSGERRGAGGGLAVDLVPVAFTSLALLEEGPYEGVYDIGLVLLQPVTGPGNDVKTEMIPDVEAASLGHFLFQEGIPLSPQQQHRRPDVVMAQREGATERKERHEKPSVDHIRPIFSSLASCYLQNLILNPSPYIQSSEQSSLIISHTTSEYLIIPTEYFSLRRHKNFTKLYLSQQH